MTTLENGSGYWNDSIIFESTVKLLYLEWKRSSTGHYNDDQDDGGARRANIMRIRFATEAYVTFENGNDRWAGPTLKAITPRGHSYIDIDRLGATGHQNNQYGQTQTLSGGAHGPRIIILL